MICSRYNTPVINRQINQQDEYNMMQKLMDELLKHNDRNRSLIDALIRSLACDEGNQAERSVTLDNLL
jgi:hypothetical protein